MRKALGRGLEALIPTRPLAEESPPPAVRLDESPHEVDIDRIHPNRYQPRQYFDEQKLQELAESMRQNGILQPVLVSPRGDDFELVAGERRLRAARLAGLSRVPVLVRILAPSMRPVQITQVLASLVTAIVTGLIAGGITGIALVYIARQPEAGEVVRRTS